MPTAHGISAFARALPRWTKHIHSSVFRKKKQLYPDISTELAESKVNPQQKYVDEKISGGIRYLTSADVAPEPKLLFQGMPKLVSSEPLGCYMSPYCGFDVPDVPPLVKITTSNTGTDSSTTHSLNLLQIPAVGYNLPFSNLVESNNNKSASVSDDNNNLPIPNLAESNVGCRSASFETSPINETLLKIPVLEDTGSFHNLSRKSGQSADMFVFQSFLHDVAAVRDANIDLTNDKLIAFAYNDSAFYTPFKMHGKKTSIGKILSRVRERGGDKFKTAIKKLSVLLFAHFPDDYSADKYNDVFDYMQKTGKKSIALPGVVDPKQFFTLHIGKDNKVLRVDRNTGSFSQTSHQPVYYWHTKYPKLFVIELDKAFAML